MKKIQFYAPKVYLNDLCITITDNMDCGQHISEIYSKAKQLSKTLGYLRNLAFAQRSFKEVAYKTLVQL